MELIFKCDTCGKVLDRSAPSRTKCWSCFMGNTSYEQLETFKYSSKTPKPINRTLTKEKEINMPMKQCSQCKEILSLNKFSRSIKSPDGYKNTCKLCIQKNNAAKGLSIFKDFIIFDKPFMLNDLKSRADISLLELENYIWALQEMNILNYDDKTDAYIILDNKDLKNFIEEHNIIKRDYSEDNAQKAISQNKLENLIKSLKDENYTTRTNSVIELGNVRDKRAVNPLIGSLADKNHLVRIHAVDALFKLKNFSLTPLINALNSDNHFIQMYSAEVLGRIGDKKAIKPLSICLNDDHYLVRYHAVLALGNIGDEKVIPYLVKSIEDEDNLVKGSAKESLVNLGKLVTKSILKELKEKDSSIKEDLIEIICKIGDEDALHTFVKLFENNKKLRVPIAESFEKIADETILNFLIESLDDDDPYVRRHIIKTLSNIVPKLSQIKRIESLEKLKTTLKNEADTETKKELKTAIAKINKISTAKDHKLFHESVRSSSNESFKKCNECGKSLPLSNFKKGIISGEYSNKCTECDKKQAASYALKKIKDYIALDIPFTKKYLKQKIKISDFTVERYLNALMEFKFLNYDEEKKEYILKESQDLDSFCEEYKIELSIKDNYKQIKSKPQGSLLIQITALESENWFKRRSAARNLGDIGDEAAIPYLIEALKDETTFVKLNVIESLGKIGNETAIEPLLLVSEDNNPNVKDKALESIENIRNRLGIDEIPKKETKPIKSNEETYPELSDAASIQINALDHKDWFTRKNAVKNLRNIGDKSVVPHLIKALKDDNKYVKTNVIEVLSEIGNETAIQPLIHAADDVNSEIEEKALDAVNKIKNRLNLDNAIEDDSSKNKNTKSNNKTNGFTIFEDKESSEPDIFSKKLHLALTGNGAIEGLKQIKSFVTLDIPFSTEQLSKAGLYDSNTKRYLHNLQELDLLEYNKDNDEFSLKYGEKLEEFCKDNDINLKKFNGYPQKDNLKVCEDCGQSLPLVEFYKTKSEEDGYFRKCKNCIRKNNAANGLNEIKKYCGFNAPFSKERLKKNIDKSNNTIMQYLRDLTDLGILEYNKDTDTYVLKQNEKLKAFCIKNNIDLNEVNSEHFNEIRESTEDKLTDLKVCEDCRHSLPLTEFYKTKSEEDGYSKKCKSCMRKNMAANGLRKIIKVIKPGIPFTKAKIKRKINKVDSTIQTYLRDLKDLNLLDYNELTDKYTLIPSEELKEFCIKYDIDLPYNTKLYSKNEENTSEDNSKLDNLHKQLIQISNQTEGHFILKLRETVDKSGIMPLLKDIEEKILNLKLLEISITPLQNTEDSNYSVDVKVEINSNDLPAVINNLKSIDDSIRRNMEISGVINLKL